MKKSIVYLWKKIWVAFLVMTVCASLFSCKNREKKTEESEIKFELNAEVRQLDYDVTEPLVVFCECDNGIIANFQSNYPDIPLEIHYTHWFGTEDIEDMIFQYGEPDIIIGFNLWTDDNVRFVELYEEGYIADIQAFYGADGSIVESDYVPDTFEVMTTDNAMIGMPLSWATRCLLIRDSKWKGSEFSYLEEGYTGSELFSVLKIEQEKPREEDEYFWAHTSTFTDILDDLYEMNVLSHTESGEIVIDEDLFELLYNFRVKIEKEQYTLPRMGTHPAINQDALNGKYFGCTLFGAPQIAAVYAKSGAAFEGEEAHIYWIPMINDGDEYIGQVKDVAMVGANSKRKQQAYDVIRLMMDMPIEVYKIAGWNNAPQTYSPVNINRAMQLLEEFDSKEENLVIKDFDDNFSELIPKEKLSEQEKKQIQKIIMNMSGLHFELDGVGLYEIYANNLVESLDDEEINHRLCYFEIMRALNPESEKWNLTREEIHAFVNQTESQTE